METENQQEKGRIYALVFGINRQREMIQAHCLGDCGKLSMGGAIDIDLLGPCVVCCQEECPHLHDQAGPFGESELTGDEVFVRVLKHDDGGRPT